MSKPKTIKQKIDETEYNLSKYKFIYEKFSDLTVSNDLNKYSEILFKSKSVNKSYNNLSFISSYDGLYAIPYFELEFCYQNKIELIKIYSSPMRNRLAYIERSWKSGKPEGVIKFSKFSVNLKTNNFKDDMLQECSIQILQFIRSHSGYKIDDKHLNPRLKKLLIFN